MNWEIAWNISYADKPEIVKMSYFLKFWCKNVKTTSASILNCLHEYHCVLNWCEINLDVEMFWTDFFDLTIYS